MSFESQSAAPSADGLLDPFQVLALIRSLAASAPGPNTAVCPDTLLLPDRLAQELQVPVVAWNPCAVALWPQILEGLRQPDQAVVVCSAQNQAPVRQSTSEFDCEACPCDADLVLLIPGARRLLLFHHEGLFADVVLTGERRLESASQVRQLFLAFCEATFEQWSLRFADLRDADFVSRVRAKPSIAGIRLVARTLRCDLSTASSVRQAVLQHERYWASGVF